MKNTISFLTTLLAVFGALELVKVLICLFLTRKGVMEFNRAKGIWPERLGEGRWKLCLNAYLGKNVITILGFLAVDMSILSFSCIVAAYGTQWPYMVGSAIFFMLSIIWVFILKWYEEKPLKESEKE